MELLRYNIYNKLSFLIMQKSREENMFKQDVFVKHKCPR